jgi:hypothetical protein
MEILLLLLLLLPIGYHTLFRVTINMIISKKYSYDLQAQENLIFWPEFIYYIYDMKNRFKKDNNEYVIQSIYHSIKDVFKLS